MVHRDPLRGPPWSNRDPLLSTFVIVVHSVVHCDPLVVQRGPLDNQVDLGVDTFYCGHIIPAFSILVFCFHLFLLYATATPVAFCWDGDYFPSFRKQVTFAFVL